MRNCAAPRPASVRARSRRAAGASASRRRSRRSAGRARSRQGAPSSRHGCNGRTCWKNSANSRRASGRAARTDALELLRALALRFPGGAHDADAPVTVSPHLVDPVVRYDGIWVASLSADVLPRPIAPDPFLPRSAQLAAGIPQASEAARASQATALLYAWRAATSELVLSVPAREKDLELLPTALVGPWPAPEAPAAAGLWLPQRLRRVRAHRIVRGCPRQHLEPAHAAARYPGADAAERLPVQGLRGAAPRGERARERRARGADGPARDAPACRAGAAVGAAARLHAPRRAGRGGTRRA